MKRKENFKTAEFRCKCNQCIGMTEIHSLRWESKIKPILERIRHSLGDEPIYINSGVRCKVHNRRVGGARNSMHLDGLAVDIRHHSYSTFDLFWHLKENQKRYHITELIKYNTFVHIGFRIPDDLTSRI